MKPSDEKVVEGNPGPTQKRLMQRAKSIRAKLGRPTDLADPFPAKRKEMSWQTYWQLFAEGTAAERSLASFLHKPKLRQSSSKKWKRKKPPRGFFDFARSSEVREVLEGLRVPNRVKALLTSLDNIVDAKGILLIEGSIDLAAIFMIASHNNAMHVEQIRQTSWSQVNLDQEKSRYSRNIAEFNRLFCIEVPDSILELNHYHRCMRALGRTGAAFDDLDTIGFGSLETGIFKSVFSARKPVERDALSCKHGHASLNFFPVFDYGSDGLTHGLLFDYCDNAFSPCIGHLGDGNFYAKKGIWDCLSAAFDIDTPESCFEEEEITYKDLNAVLAGEELGYELLPWFYNLATTGYLNFHSKPSIRVKGAAGLRYSLDLDAEWFRQSAMQNGLLFMDPQYGFYPSCPIRIEGNFNAALTPQYLESLLRVFGLNFSNGSIKRFLESAKRKNSRAFRVMGLDSLMGTPRQQGQSRKPKSNSDTQSFLNAVEIFCNDEIKAGRPYLALFVGLYAWECMEERTTELSADLLKNLPDDICHPLIKVVTKLHSKTRFDKKIHD